METDSTAFDELARRHYPELRRVAAGVVGDADADDVVQQTLLRAWRALRRGEQVRDPRRWLLAIAHRTAIDVLRSRGPETAQLDPEHDGVAQPPSVYEGRERLRETVDAIASLPERQRFALTRSVFEERSAEDIAGEMGTTRGAVEQLIHRARRGLRNGLSVLIPFALLRRGATVAAVLALATGTAGVVAEQTKPVPVGPPVGSTQDANSQASPATGRAVLSGEEIPDAAGVPANAP